MRINIMKDLTTLKSFNEDEYNELLQQAVAVIESSRLQIAKQLNTVAMWMMAYPHYRLNASFISMI